MSEFDSKGSDLIFLLSLPRSGSTLLQRILGAHSSIHTTGEPWLMLNPLYALRGSGHTAEYDAELARQGLEDFLAQFEDGRSAYLESIRNWATELYGRALQQSGKSLFLDKTPRYYHILPELREVFPKARFVFLLRNPLAVLSSTLRTWFENEPEKLIDTSNYKDLTQGVNCLAEGLRIFGEQALIVRYEDLVTSPRQTIESLCQTMGIAFEPAMLEYGQFTAPEGRHGDQIVINKHTSAVPDYLDAWKANLADESRKDFACEYLQQLGSECFRRLGYDFDAARRVLRDPPETSLKESTPDQHEPADIVNAQGERLYLAGDIDAAKRCFEQALIEDPGFVLAHNNLAVLYWQANDPENAVIQLSEGLSKYPGHRDLTITAGQIFSALGMPKDAAALYSAYLMKKPDDPEILKLDAELAAENSPDPLSGETNPADEKKQTDSSEIEPGPAVMTPISIITSIAPKGIEKQKRAVQSWLDVGFEVLSLNIQKEIDILQNDFPGVKFVRAKRDGSQLAGRPYVFIDDMLAVLKGTEHEVVGIVNSDIIIRANSSLIDYLNREAPGNFLYASRIDIDKFEDVQGKVYHRGFDLFFFDRNIIDRIPKTKFMLGIPWWDYWVPVAPLLHNIPIKRLDGPLGFHVWHETNYSDVQLIQFAREFAMHSEDASFIAQYQQCVEGKYGNVRYSVLSDAALDYLARNSQRVSLPESVLTTTDPLQGNNSGPKVTAIVSTYKSEAFIEGCLENLVNQSIADQMEIVVIDAASPQNEAAIVERFQKKYSNIRYHRTPERIGVYAAWNLVVEMAKGEYLITCSTNDRLREDACEIMARSLDEQPDVALTYGNSFLSKVAHDTFEAPTICGLYVWPEYSYELLLDRCMVGPHPMWRRSVHADVGLFDESLLALADQEFWLRLGENHRLLNIPDFTGVYYVSEDSITGDMDLTQTETDRIHASYGWRYRYAQWFSKRYRRDDESCRVTSGPLMHIVAVMQAENGNALANTIDSVSEQLYSNWKLTVIAESACPDPLFEEHDRLQWVETTASTPLGDELNRIVAQTGAEWIAAIEAGERLDPSFLSDGYAYIKKHEDWRLIYFDDDRADLEGNLIGPRFKPDMNLDLLRCSSYIGNACLVNRDALDAVGGFGSSDYALLYDLVLKIFDEFGRESIGHVADIRFHRNFADAVPIAELSVEHRRNALVNHLQRCGENAGIRDASIAGCFLLEHNTAFMPKVSILIPAVDPGDYLADCVVSVLEKTDYPNFEVRLLVKSGENTPLTEKLETIARQDKRVTLSYTRANKANALNEFASGADGDYLLWLNQNIVVLQNEWLRRLVACGVRDKVGVVGPRIVNRRKTLVSGGIVTGIGSRGAGARCNEDLHMLSEGYMGRAQLEQETDAVPSLCMLISKDLFTQSGGFDPQLSISLYHDIDLCQHIREKNKRVVWTPNVTLMYLAERAHVDGIASSDKQAEEQVYKLHQRWLKSLAASPAYNRNLNAMRGDFVLETERTRGWDPEIDHKPRILTYGTGSFGSWQYRVKQPMDVLRACGLAHVSHTPFVGKKMTRLTSVAELEYLRPTTLLMHNTMHDDFLKAMADYKRVNNAFIVFGQDDLMTALPPKNPFSKTVYKDIKKRVRKCLALADRLVVTTEPLAQALSGMVDDIRIVPNYLDESIWGNLQSQRYTGAKPRIGWAGAQQHQGDLELLEEVVRETAGEVDWIFFGMCPAFLRPYVTEVHDAVKFEKYPHKLSELNLDIALAPLEHNRFNESKSNLRLLEYGILGWSVIATDIHPYRDAPVFRVPNQAKAWIKAIRERINDLDSTWREGDVLRDWVRANWLMQQNVEAWLTVLNPSSEPVHRFNDRQHAAGL